MTIVPTWSSLMLNCLVLVASAFLHSLLNTALKSWPDTCNHVSASEMHEAPWWITIGDIPGRIGWNGGSLGEVTFRALYGANKLTQGSQNMREQVTDLKHFFWIALWLWSVTKGNRSKNLSPVLDDGSPLASAKVSGGSLGLDNPWNNLYLRCIKRCPVLMIMTKKSDQKHDKLFFFCLFYSKQFQLGLLLWHSKVWSKQSFNRRFNFNFSNVKPCSVTESRRTFLSLPLCSSLIEPEKRGKRFEKIRLFISYLWEGKNLRPLLPYWYCLRGRFCSWNILLHCGIM